MKKLILSSVMIALVAGCANTPLPPVSPPVAPLGVAQGDAVVVKDMGYPGGRRIAVDLYAPINDALKKFSLSAVAAGTCWAIADIFQYDITLTDAGDGRVLTSFTVLCKGGRAKAVFEHLRPGVRYAIKIVARGNKGGTAPDLVLNSQTPAIGYFDLRHVDPLQEGQEVSAAIQVELDCEGVGGWERTGRIDIIPRVRRGGQISYEPESGSGNCYACGDYPISAGTTTYDSMFHAGTNGDVFNTNPHHNHWTNEINGWAWVQRDLHFTYPVSRIDIGSVANDPSHGTATEIYVKLRRPDGSWIPVDTRLNQNLKNYSLRLDPPVQANAFRLEMKSAKGWLSASAITLMADTGVPCAPASTPPTAPPSATVTPPPSTPPTPGPSLPPCPTPTPAPSTVVSTPPSSPPSATPTPLATPTPTPAPTGTPIACDGPFASFTQGGWGSMNNGNNPGAFRDANWTAMTGGTLTVGVGRSLTFTSAAAIEAFLPHGGTAAVLDASATNPTTCSAGVLAGQLVTLKLNVLRSDAGLNPSGGTGKLRNVRFNSGAFTGKTIGEVLALGERAMGGDLSALPAGVSLSQLSDAATAVNEGFHDPGVRPDGSDFRCQ